MNLLLLLLLLNKKHLQDWIILKIFKHTPIDTGSEAPAGTH